MGRCNAICANETETRSCFCAPWAARPQSLWRSRQTCDVEPWQPCCASCLRVLFRMRVRLAEWRSQVWPTSLPHAARPRVVFFQINIKKKTPARATTQLLRRERLSAPARRSGQRVRLITQRSHLALFHALLYSTHDYYK